jgi:hypothetical protein
MHFFICNQLVICYFIVNILLTNYADLPIL